MSTKSIIEAMDDPNLFGPFFRGGSWKGWRAFLGTLFGLPMDDEALALYRHHTGRERPPTVAFTEATLICGRRGGKSRVLALIAAYLACFFDYAPYLAPGEIATISIIAADRKQARSILRYILGMMQAVPMLAQLIESETAESVSLSNRVVIEIHTASFRATRGYTLVAALADELGFWRDDQSANPDAEIIAALRPALASIPGAMLLKASSPYAKRGVLYNDFRKHYGQDSSRMLVWKGTTAEMNPAIDPSIIADAYEDDPANAGAEYGAEFRSDIAAFVTREVIEACTVPGRFELPAISTNRYCAFLDAAGGSGSDSMTIAISHREGDLAVLDAIRERKPPFSPDDVVSEFAALMKSYRVHKAESDKWGGDWVGEAFRKNGITVSPCAKPKSDIYREILPELNSARVELLDLPRLATQFANLERRTARGGRDSIDHAPGGHDDIANAVAGALLLASTKRGGIKISDELLQRSAVRGRRVFA